MEVNQPLLKYIPASCPFPANIHAYITTVAAGNMSSDSPDDFSYIDNRQSLIDTLALPSEPVWLKQTHSSDYVYLPCTHARPQADAVIKIQLIPFVPY